MGVVKGAGALSLVSAIMIRSTRPAGGNPGGTPTKPAATL
jgi:hypothetical protein